MTLPIKYPPRDAVFNVNDCRVRPGPPPTDRRVSDRVTNPHGRPPDFGYWSTGGENCIPGASAHKFPCYIPLRRDPTTHTHRNHGFVTLAMKRRVRLAGPAKTRCIQE